MKILSMTATFGKLEGQTLTFDPTMNVISAPNEWGKSTWCSFIVAMLYGIETSQRTSSKGLADKERFAPWSGKPMSGRMDILWNDRKITLERATRGRSIFGVFRAYETDTGMDVPELTAQNCGLTLLGVEKNVFLRAGFVRQTEMPVTDDLALRRRLNELVTTGDESGASDKLAQKLKELKNACRHNKTGLLPQTEAQRNLISDKLTQIETAHAQIEKIGQRQEEIRTETVALENHNAVLIYQEATQNLQRVEKAKAEYQTAQEAVRSLEVQCADLPALEFAQKKLRQAEDLQSRLANLQTKRQPLPPEVPAIFAGMDAEAAKAKASTDKKAYDSLQKPASPLFLILAILGLVFGIGMFFIHPLLIIGGAALALSFGALYSADGKKKKQSLKKLTAHYGDLPAECWVEMACRFAEAEKAYGVTAQMLHAEQAALQEETEALTGGKSLQEVMDTYRKAIQGWNMLADAKDNAKKAAMHAEAMAAMVKDIPKPQVEDTLTLSKEETGRRLADLTWEQNDLQKKLGQFMGQIQTLGDRDDLARQLLQVEARIAKLEDTYAALTLAQETLAEASGELQRRFAPKIAGAARDIFSRLTGGRYDRLILDQELSVSAGAEGEDTLHSAAWRSDGTIDQLYLSVRLAVAEALTPHAPIVLDDALVRFDEGRLEQTMTLLKELSGQKQVILFTCQNRESKYA